MQNEKLKPFSADTQDSDLILIIDEWVRESVPYHDFLLQKQNHALQYYEGNQTNRDRVRRYKSDTVFNRLFEGTETIIPIVTGTAQEFIALPGNDDEESRMQADKVGSFLKELFRERDVRGKLEEVVRDVILKRFGAMEYYWDSERDDIGIRVLDPRALLVPKLKVLPENLPYVIKILDFTKDQLREEFETFDITKLTAGEKIDTGGERGNYGETTKKYQVLECWSTHTVVWKHNDYILRKETNPYYDFEGEETTGGRKKIRTFYNHLSKPEIPIVFFAPFRTGDAPFASLSLAEVGIPIQDDINVGKRSIMDNLKSMGNGQWLIDSGALSEEDENKITDEPGIKIVGQEVASGNRIRREAGTPIPNAHFSNLLDSVSAFDSVFGVQPAVRGASQGKTLGGQILNREQNLSRIDLITREVNRGVSRLADGATQLAKMFYTEQRLVKMVGADDATVFIRFQREDIRDNIVIITKSGQTPEIDPAARGNRAIQLWQLGALDPVTLFEELDMPNPEKLAERLLAYKQGQLTQETQMRIAEAQAGAQIRDTEGQRTNTPRQVESNLNSRQRTEQNILGSAPVALPNTPKTENT